MVYAQGTKVDAIQTRQEIERTLERYGAASFSWHIEARTASLQFQIKARFIRFRLPLPEPGGAKQERMRRERWRALLLVLKAKLESVSSGIETIDESFLAQIVMPDGETVGSYALPEIAQAYKDGKMPPRLALPAPSGPA